MKKLPLVLAALLMLAGTSVASAQDQPPRMGGGRGNMVAMLMQGITLTAEQQARVDSIAAKYGEQRRALMQDETADRETRMARSRELMTKQTDEIKALLTDEQKKMFEKNLEDMAARRQQGGQRPPR